jgi:DNA (cytosine-5)-methyltransferase 1
MKVLNLYAGIGGNRKLWTDVEVTAVESDPNIAKQYKKFFPLDNVLVCDAHQYLLENIRDDWGFIWSSVPCPTHSIIRAIAGVGRGQVDIVYPDMRLYQEIIILKHFARCKFCVENVIGYYEPLIRPHQIERHYFWVNFHIGDYKSKKRDKDDIESLKRFTGFDIEDKLLLRNCVEPELGLHILNESKKDVYQELFR